MKVVVDLNRCQGYGQCVFSAPDVFWMEGQEALFFDYAPADEQRDRVTQAAAACPMRAILVEDAGDELRGYDRDAFEEPMPS